MGLVGDRWAVIGGGILGMTLADRLARHGCDVTLIERAEQVGGLAGAWSLGDVVWDRHYHVTLLSDTYTRSLLRDLGLEPDVEWVETRTGFFTNGRMYSMSNTVEFLRFPPLGLVDKLRLAATILIASRIRDWRRLERIPVADWLRRWSGQRTFEKIWRPLLRSKLGDTYSRISAAFIWATIARMYAARRSGLKKEMFGYVPGGYSRILEAFSRRLAEASVSVRLGTRVREVSRYDPGGVVVACDDDDLAFDRVVLTVPPPVAAKLVPDLTADERHSLEGVEYQGIVCASLLLRRPLGGYYVTNITDPGIPFTAVIEMTALVDSACFAGQTLVYLPKYTAEDSEDFATPDAVWRERFVSGLKAMYPDVTDDDVAAFRVSRQRFVFALPTLGYSERQPPRRTSIPGLFLVNSAQIVNGTLNVNETIRLAEAALPDLLDGGSTNETARRHTAEPAE